MVSKKGRIIRRRGKGGRGSHKFVDSLSLLMSGSHFWSICFSLCSFKCLTLTKGINTCKINPLYSFVWAYFKTSWKTRAELSHFSLKRLHRLPPFSAASKVLNEILSFIERKKGALWSYYENRLWSESGNCLRGNVKVSKISSTSKDGDCMFERIHLRIEIACRRVILLSVHGEADKSLGRCDFVQRGSRY